MKLGVAADHIEKDVIAHIADLSVIAGPSKEDLDNFQDMVEAKLCEVTGAVRAVRPVKSAASVPTVDTYWILAGWCESNLSFQGLPASSGGNNLLSSGGAQYWWWRWC